MDKNIGQQLISSASFAPGADELSRTGGTGGGLIIHEGGSEKDCHFCLKKKNTSDADFRLRCGTYHEYTERDPFYDCGVWKAFRGKDGLQIDSISDEYIELWSKLISEKS